MAVKYRDYYETLGVTKTASQDEIKKAFKKLARQYHPDVAKDQPDAEERFKAVNEAYEVLGDAEKRQKYDTLGPGWEQGQDFGGYSGHPGGGHYDYNFGGSTGFSDFFESMFGGRGGGDPFSAYGGARGGRRPRSTQPMAGEDIEADLLVRIEEIMHGSTREVRLARPTADGQRGKETTIRVKIPKGIAGGQRIRCGGMGYPGVNGGPEGDLYVATGDAGEPDSAQDLDSLAGKILRTSPDGSIPRDNPFPDSAVWSLGHRNVQGLAFDSAGRLWATEFGTNIADELNLITPGGNYGWPAVEGTGGGTDYIDPQAQWAPTSLASPSGVAILGDVAYVASLRGEVVWQVPLVGDRAGTPIALDLGSLGRLRTIQAMPDGTLWLITSNTDGRGDPRDADDRILALTPA